MEIREAGVRLPVLAQSARCSGAVLFVQPQKVATVKDPQVFVCNILLTRLLYLAALAGSLI